MLEGQAPADFHARCKRRVEACDCQSDETDQGRDIRDFERPQAKTMLAEMPLDSVDHSITLGAAEAAAEELHHPRIGIHGGKRLPISVPPSAQTDAFAGQC